MIPEYIKLQVDELLDKFGAGSHKPGSGSAAALLGLISCKLIQTVISLTSSKKNYRKSHSRFANINSDIVNNIEPILHEVLQEDSVQFHKVITARRNRDATNDYQQKFEFEEKEFEALKAAIDLPLEITKNCLVLAEYAIEVFDVGFKSARGDSAVAISSALSGASGALPIIYLNLTKFWGDAWAIDMMRETDKIYKRIQKLEKELLSRIKKLQIEAVEANAPYKLKLGDLRNPKITGKRISDKEIESIAKKFQNTIWKNRRRIWKEDIPINPVDVLKPEYAFGVIGFNFKKELSLGQFSLEGEVIEIAGYIDSSKKYAGISTQFPPEVQNFTAAHELGHALLHNAIGLHRDRALSGETIVDKREQVEQEADKFAAYFLMPEEFVINSFRNIFKTDRFVINQDTAFALSFESEQSLRKKCRTKRDLSRLLASTEQYRSVFFDSLASRFGVSKEAMAIRLEELPLIEF